jgi:hypothetical protein
MTNLSNPVWANAAHTRMHATLDNGEVILLNADPGLSHYDSIITSGVLIAPFVPPVPRQVSSRQFWTQAALQGLISENDAVNALGGEIPHAIRHYINGLAASQRFVARMFFEAPTFERDTRLASDVQACFSLNSAAVDLFFQHAAGL